MLRQIRTQLLIIIISFSLLVLGSFTVTFLYIQDHAADEMTEKIIREHRLSIQRLTWLALVDPQNPSIPVYWENIENNLTSVPSTGTLIPLEGESHKLPAPTDIQVRQHYQSIAQLWPAYRVQLEKALNNPEVSSADEAIWIALQSQSRQLINGFDTASEVYEQHTNYQHTRLRLLQVGFILFTVPLLIAGIYIIGYRIVRPLNYLNQSAQQIRKGNLHQPVTVIRKDEIGQLANSMETMRAQISANQHNLEASIAERTHELTIAARFSQEIAHELDAEQIIKSVTIQAQKLLRAKKVSLCLVTPNGKCIQMVARGSELLAGERPQQPLINELVFADEDQTLVTDIANSQCEFLKSDSADQCLSSSLQVGEKIIGALCVVRDQKSIFDENERRAFSLLANSAAIALLNSRLIKKDKQQAREAAILAERQRLASELHDDLAQNLGVSQMQVNQILTSLSINGPSDSSKDLEIVQANLQVAHEMVRMAISGLSTSKDDGDLGLQEDINSCIADFQKITGTPVELQASGTPWEKASSIVQRQVVQILREALVNIRRHARADTVRINITKVADHLELQIIDDGQGFNPDLASGDQHFGLEIMHARAERSGGNLEIISSPGSGTEIKAIFPLGEISEKNLEIGETFRE